MLVRDHARPRALGPIQAQKWIIRMFCIQPLFGDIRALSGIVTGRTIAGERARRGSALPVVAASAQVAAMLRSAARP